MQRAFRAHGIHEFAHRVFEKGDLASDGRILDVNVYYGEKNRNAMALAPDEFSLARFVHHIHFAVPWCEDLIGSGRHRGVRVPKEIKGENGEKHPQADEHGHSNRKQEHGND